MDNFNLKKYLAESKLLKENIDFPEMEDEFEGAMDAMVVEPEVYLKDILNASANDLVSDDYYEVMNAVEQGVYSKDEAVKLAKSWAKEKLSTLAEGVIEENITKLDNYALEIYSDFRKDPSIHFPDVEFEVDEEGFALENDSNYSQLKKYKREIMGLHALFGEESGVKDKNGLQLSMDGVIDNI